MDAEVEPDDKRTTKERMVLLVFVGDGRARLCPGTHVSDAAWGKRNIQDVPRT